MFNSAGRTAQEREARAKRRVELSVIGEEWCAFFDRFFSIPLANKTVTEDFRQQYCLECRRRVDEDPSLRELHCKSWRCHMYETDGFDREREWALQSITRLLPAVFAQPDDIAEFNSHISRAGCLTPTIGVTKNDSLAANYQAETLRAVVQLGLFLAVTYSAGDRLRIHVGDHSGDTAREMHLAERDRHTQYKQELLARINNLNHRPKLKKTKLAEKLDVTPQTLLKWMKEKDTHVPDPGSVARWVPQVLPPSHGDGEDRLIETLGDD